MNVEPGEACSGALDQPRLLVALVCCRKLEKTNPFMQSCIPSNACLIEEIVRGEDLTSKVKNALKSLFVRTLQNASFLHG